MKIQFSGKSEVSWDTLVEAVESEQFESSEHQDTQTCKKWLWRQCCGRPWLTLAFIVCLATFIQLWVFLYLFTTWDLSPVTHLIFIDELGNKRHVHFSWSNCGSQSDPVQLKQLQVTPDPVKLHENITLSLDAHLDLFLDAPISAAVKVKRKMGWFWVKVPCLDELGSCYYRDVCGLSPFLPSDPCPDPFPRFGLPCNCPVAKGHYEVEGGIFNIPNLPKYLPSWLVSGDYYIHAIANKDGRPLGCYSFYVSVSR